VQSNEFGWGQYVRSFVKRERKSGYLPAVFDVRFGSKADMGSLRPCASGSYYFTGNKSATKVRNCQSDAPVGRTAL
jgi:hypothetical protein